MFAFLLVVHAVIAAALVTVILMQRSEGGGLGMGGSPSGLMSARGAADFLTRATSVLAAAFIAFSVLLAVLASTRHIGSTIDTSLAHRPVATQPAQPATTQPVPAEPVAPFSGNANISGPAAVPTSRPAPSRSDTGVPLAR